MPDFEHFIHRLECNEELTISKISSSRKKKFRITFATLIFLNVAVLIGAHKYPFVVIGYTLISTFVYVKLKKLFRIYSTIYIKGDTMIVKNARKQFCVTSIRSITNIISKKFMKITFTTVQYCVDNDDRVALMINKKERHGKTAPDLLNSALNYYKNKKTNL